MVLNSAVRMKSSRNKLAIVSLRKKVISSTSSPLTVQFYFLFCCIWFEASWNLKADSESWLWTHHQLSGFYKDSFFEITAKHKNNNSNMYSHKSFKPVKMKRTTKLMLFYAPYSSVYEGMERLPLDAGQPVCPLSKVLCIKEQKRDTKLHPVLSSDWIWNVNVRQPCLLTLLGTICPHGVCVALETLFKTLTQTWQSFTLFFLTGNVLRIK